MTHWLFPANTRYYDIFGASSEDETFWPTNTTAEIGDTAYIYLAAPYKQVGFICDVTGVGFDEDQVLTDVRSFFKQPVDHKKRPRIFIKLRPVAAIPLGDDSPLKYERLKQNGLTGMLMGPRKLENKPELLTYIKGVCDEL